MIKKIYMLVLLVSMGTIWSCNDDNFVMTDPDVGQFVSMLKKGEYAYYERVDSSTVCLAIPRFTERHLDDLIKYSNDTTHIAKFPIDMSLLSGYTPQNYYVLGECLLQTVEQIRVRHSGIRYPSGLNMCLKKEGKTSIHGDDILIVQKYYQKWWDENQNAAWDLVNPLHLTGYYWEEISCQKK